MMNILYRKAAREHIDGIHTLVQRNSSPHALLPRSRQSIEATIENWIVAVQGSRIIGCGSLMAYESGLVEIRSLAVDDEFRGLGIGRTIVETLVSDARQRGLKSVFALTRAAHLFHTCGFKNVPIECFPEKVIHFCSACPNRDNCDETAVVLQLAEEPFICHSTGRHVLSQFALSILPGSVLLVP